MAKLLCVFSTLASSVRYAARSLAANGVHIEGEGVVIKGGAGVANEHILTPKGVATMVTEAQAEALKADPVFKLHAQNGFVKLETVERPPGEGTVEKTVAGMEGRDNSAPLVSEDFTANGQAAPSTDAPKS